MKTTLTAIALAATLVQPAAAVTFPSLTTIYVGAGVSSFVVSPQRLCTARMLAESR